MEDHDLFQRMVDITINMDKALGSLGRLGREAAMTERDYRVGLRKAILIERNKGTPVTIISDICRGEEDIADLKFKRDVADSLYRACLEGINVLKIELRVMEGQIDREYNRR